MLLTGFGLSCPEFNSLLVALYEATYHLSASNQLTEVFNPLTPMSDQERFLLTKSIQYQTKKVMRIS